MQTTEKLGHTLTFLLSVTITLVISVLRHGMLARWHAGTLARVL